MSKKELDEIKHRHDVLRAELELDELLIALSEKYKLSRWDLLEILQDDTKEILKAIREEKEKKDKT